MRKVAGATHDGNQVQHMMVLWSTERRGSDPRSSHSQQHPAALLNGLTVLPGYVCKCVEQHYSHVGAATR